MRIKRPSQPTPDWSTKKVISLYLLVLCTSTICFITVFEFFESTRPLGSDSHVQSLHTGPSSAQTTAGSINLGFAYPQLARTRQLVASSIGSNDLDWSAISRAYTSALASLLKVDSNSDKNNSSNQPAASRSPDLQEFLVAAIAVLATGTGHLQCTKDHSLLVAWQAITAVAHSRNTTVEQASSVSQAAGVNEHSGLSHRNYLLAANFHNSAAVLPNSIVQTVRLALLLPPGHFAVSVYESGSSDLTRMWLTLLHYLLLPLGVPHNITTAGSLSPRLGLPRIELLARLRNALIEPWLGQQRHNSRSAQESHRLRGAAVARARGRRQHAAAAAAGSAELSYKPGRFTPDTVIFANDVYLCAEDVLRLVMHDAHIACGMDFYTAPWQQQQRPDEVSGGATGVAATDDQGSSTVDGSSSGQAPQVLDDDDFFDPDSLQLQHSGNKAAANTGSTGGGGGGSSLRFYDKWVARDISGLRLRNRHPFIKHTDSLLQLTAGQPVPMRCCWNGLAVLAAAPFHTHGVRFRTHQPGECAGSECSLLCEDFHRLGYSHAVMDPAVRLAYDIEQVDALGGAAMTADASIGHISSHSGVYSSSSDNSSIIMGWGPRLSWSEVAATSAQLASDAQLRTAAVDECRQGQQQAGSPGATAKCSLWMECCDLQPGHSYVNFRRDCHMVDIMAHNYTAEVTAPNSPAAANAA